MERKPGVFASFREQLELLDCISRVSEGSGLTALHRLGQAEVITPVQVDVLVQQWGKTLDVLVPGGLAGEASVALLLRGREEVNRHTRKAGDTRDNSLVSLVNTPRLQATQGC